MSTTYHILDLPLPLSQDFRKLKELGLEYIQEHSGNSWSNLNPSDPGVTILDQVCYALTELGYVNDFPVSDILTRRDEQLQIKDQFYLPEEMLTTSPVTLDDYRKYIIDGVAGVTNVVIAPVKKADNACSGVYNVYLQVNEEAIAQLMNKKLPEVTGPPAVCQAVFFYLNKRRNLNEFFNMPAVFTKELHAIKGRLEIQNSADLNKILRGINDQVRNFILPDVVPVSYEDLDKAGVATNEIFNGPLLLNGWITTGALGTKKERLHVFELTGLLNRIPGINSASGLTLGDDLQANAPDPDTCIYTVDAFSSFEKNLLEIYCGDQRIMPVLNTFAASSKGKLLKADNNIRFGAIKNIQTELPKGRFRNIDSYYSIQNTFPEIYAVGANTADEGAPAYQVAQSRQLKGYLTLFDQVLANQFSQLANLDRLFSFKNAVTDSTQDFRRRHHKYPAPYKTFSPTYFYQPLYKVPQIRPLLKRNETFNFGIHAETELLREERSWKKYKYDPYNPYIRGLMNFMEDERNSLERRNEILDHLLAQNGESPYVIDQVIDPLLYAGDRVKGQIIFKSLYLQNLGMLSYYRQKAYNYIGATRIGESIPDVKPDFMHRILGGETMDFIFRSGKIDKLEKIKKQDFINYSALELKLFLLLGLRIQYLNYISENYEVTESSENIKLAQWMIRERRGVIAIETGLLFRPGGDILTELQKDPVFNNKVILFFPDFIPGLIEPDFEGRLELLCESAMPAEVPCQPYLLGTGELQVLISVFAVWHNELIYSAKKSDNYENAEARASAELIALFIITINDRKNAGSK
jgi:hypothetical protein